MCFAVLCTGEKRKAVNRGVKSFASEQERQRGWSGGKERKWFLFGKGGRNEIAIRGSPAPPSWLLIKKTCLKKHGQNFSPLIYLNLGIVAWLVGGFLSS